jgi:hypothetical protein
MDRVRTKGPAQRAGLGRPGSCITVQMVTVCIRPQNQIFNILKDDLSQSPVLYGYIHGKPGGLFIMDPELMEVSSGGFGAVDEFRNGRVSANVSRRRTDGGYWAGDGRLDGIDTHREDSVQIKRLARLCLLARILTYRRCSY